MMRLASLWPLGPCGNTATDEMIVVVVRKRAAANLPGIPAKNRARNALRNCTGAMLALMLWNASAEAHGDADWIRKMQLGCCGPTDCARVPDGTWIRQGGGYLHTLTGEFIADANAKASVDEHYWECRIDNGKIRPVIAREGGMCLFVPAIGF